MKIEIIAVGTRLPSWTDVAFAEYSKRMPDYCKLVLHEVSTAKRKKYRHSAEAISDEGQRMLSLIPENNHVIALEVKGQQISTEQLADRLKGHLQSGQNITYLIGGPDGLASDCLERANETWSLSNLTFAHALVRVLLAEQLYRAWTILQGHPYHRSS